MPMAEAADGTKLHWEERGSGPTVILVPYWSMVPPIFDPLEKALLDEHRVVRYEDRGTGRSDRVGPHDLDTGADDLECVLEAVGGAAAAVCLIDAGNRAVRVAERNPDLLGEVVCVGSAPFSVGAFAGSDALIASGTVLGAFMMQLEADYRGAVRSAIGGANNTMNEDELRERVQLVADFCDAQASLGRIRSWVADERGPECAKALGPRLRIVLTHAIGGAGAWFPEASELEPIARDLFPEAAIEWTSDGMVSAPSEVASVISRVTASDPDYDRQR